MSEPEINQHELYKILSIVGDDMPTGVELLNLFIKGVALGYAQQVIKDMRLEINKKQTI